LTSRNASIPTKDRVTRDALVLISEALIILAAVIAMVILSAPV
jgi:hypothetical protein